VGLIAYVLLAIVSLASVWKFFEPLSLRAAAALALLPLLFTARAFISGGIYAPIDLAYQTEPLVGYLDRAGVHDFRNSTLSDTYAQMIPWRAVVREAIFSGDWPLINPYMLGGDLLAGSAQPAPYDFINLAGLVVPLIDGINLTASLALLWAAIGAFVLARRYGVGELAAIFAAVAWTCSSFVIFFIESALGHTVILLPLLCCAAIDVVRRPTLACLRGVAVILAWVACSGHPETLMQMALIASAFGIYELWRIPENRRRAIVIALGGGALAILLSAVYLLPLIDALPQTSEYAARRVEGSEDLLTVSWKSALMRLPANVVPFVYGTPWREMSSAPPLISPHTAHISGGFLGLAFAGAVVSRRRERWFLIGIGVFGLLCGIGFPPFVHAFSHIPLLSLARNERFIAATVLALALLASMAVDSRDALRTGWVILIVAVALLLLSLAMIPTMHEIRLSDTFIRSSMAALLIPMVLAAAVAIGSRRPEVAFSAMLMIILVQRTAGVGTMYPTMPRRAFYPEPVALKHLPGGLYRFVAEGYALLPNIGTHYGLEDVRGFQAMSLQRLEETFPLWCVRQRNWFNRVDSLASPFLSFLNVRYALHDPEQPMPDRWRAIGTAGRMDIVENTVALPRAFIPRVVHHGDDLEAMKHATDFGAESWIDRAVEETNGAGNVSISRTYLSGYAMHADLLSDAWIVISQPAWKGWRAFVGGHEIPVRIANHAFLAIRLGRGSHDVVLRFRPHSFEIGRAITLLGIALVIGLSIWSPRS
jgi:membrane protein YfhO